MLPLLLACSQTPTPTPEPPPVTAIVPQPVVDDSSTLTVHLSASDGGFSGIEVVCPGGYRNRAQLKNGVARLQGVPDEDCSMLMKGGAPAMYGDISAGVWQCSFAGTTLTCEPS